MRNETWNIAAFILVLMLVASTATAQGLNGWFDMVHSVSREYEDGERISDSDSLNRNLYLNFQKPITPMLTYQINLRTNFTDSDSTDAAGDTTTTYRRSVEPALDLIFANPVYDLSLGYRRQENWDAAHLDNENRTTTEFYYSRFNVTPGDLPTLNLQFDKQKNYDHFDERKTDEDNTSYSVGSSYELPSRDVRLRYNINYSRIINRTPLNPSTNKTINDNFNGNYNVGYAGTLWKKRMDYSVKYQGNYSRNKSRQFVDQTGTVVNERLPLGGLYAQDTTPPIEQNVDQLSSQNDLIDDDLEISTGIGLSAAGDEFQNIGIAVSSQRPVDRLYVYVNRNITADAALSNDANWQVFRSNFNQTGTWIDVPIQSVTISVVDSALDIYRYEIEFTSAQGASFYKAVNLALSDVLNVFVTEIEALGADTLDEDVDLNVTHVFTQGLNFNTRIRALPELTVSLHYSLDRTDQNPESPQHSVKGVFENIYSDSLDGENTGFSSNLIRNYGASSVWLTHRLLSTTLRFQRNESFDDSEETDVSTNTYQLAFNSVPLPTLDVGLSLIKNDSFEFDEKDSTGNSVLLTVGARLHRDVNSITDIGYSRTESFDNESTTSSRQITGTIDAVITPKLSGTLNYGFVWTSSSDGTSSRSRDGTMVLTYRPGRFININGNLTVSDSEGDVTTSEGLLIDWLPLKAVRLNMNYRHSDSDAGPVKTDTVGGYVIWYAAKFVDIRFTYNYTQRKEDTTTEIYNYNTNINCRF